MFGLFGLCLVGTGIQSVRVGGWFLGVLRLGLRGVLFGKMKEGMTTIPIVV